MSLREFLTVMERRGELLSIEDPVSSRHEVSYLVRELEEGPILLFRNVDGHGKVVVANVCGSRERLGEALMVDRKGLHGKMASLMRSPTPPEVVGSAPSQEVVEKPSLSDIPVLTHFDGDGGPYITAGVVYARDVKGDIENVSIHRLQILDDSTMAIRLVPRHLYALWRSAKMEGKNLEVVISVGLHPAVLLAAACSPPLGVNEFHVANAMMNGGLKLVRALEVKGYAPAEAELIIEGEISCEKEVLEGPLTDILGIYDIERMQPLVEVKAIAHRRHFLYQALLPGGREHKLLMGLPREAEIREGVSRVIPHVEDVVLTMAGGGWLHALISIKKQSEGDGKNAILAALAAHPSLKHVVVVDEDINIHDPNEVEWAIATRFQAHEDTVIIRNARGSSLDPSSDQERILTSKLGLDATRPLDKPIERFKMAEIPANDKVISILERLKELERG